MLGEQERSDYGGDGEGRDQGPGQRVAVGARHGAEDLALDSLHGEQRHETGHRDERREQNRLVHLHGADQNQPQAIRPVHALALRASAICVGSGPQSPSARRWSRPCLSSVVALKIPEDVLDQDDGRIHDDAEIHRAHGQQVGAFAQHHQQNGGEEQRERDVQSHDDRAAKIAQENPLDQEDQQTSENQVVQNRVRGEGDQRRAVVKRNDLDSRRQTPVVIQPVDRLLDLRNHVGGFFRPPLHDDRPDHVVVLVPAQNAEPRPEANRHLADILDQHRDAVLLAQNHILNVVNLVTLPLKSSLPPSSIRPTPRILMDCWPMRISRPPTLTLALPSAVRI